MRRGGLAPLRPVQRRRQWQRSRFESDVIQAACKRSNKKYQRFIGTFIGGHNKEWDLRLEIFRVVNEWRTARRTFLEVTVHFVRALARVLSLASRVHALLLVHLFVIIHTSVQFWLQESETRIRIGVNLQL